MPRIGGATQGRRQPWAPASPEEARNYAAIREDIERLCMLAEYEPDPSRASPSEWAELEDCLFTGTDGDGPVSDWPPVDRERILGILRRSRARRAKLIRSKVM